MATFRIRRPFLRWTGVAAIASLAVAIGPGATPPVDAQSRRASPRATPATKRSAPRATPRPTPRRARESGRPVATSAAATTATPSPAPTPATLTARLDDARRRRQRVEKELERLSAQQQTTLTEIDRLDLELRLAGHKLEEAEIETRRANAALDQTLRQIRALETGLAKAKPKVAQSVVALHKLGELSYARMLISVQNPTDLLRGYRFVARVAEADRDRLTAFRRDIAKMHSLRADLKSRTAESLAQRQRQTEAQRVLSAERARTEERLAEIADRRETQEQLARDAREQEESLVRLLETAGESLPAMAPSPAPVVSPEASPDAAVEPSPEAAPDIPQVPSEPEPPFARMKGDLPWPLSGGVTERFGLLRHPRFDTITVQQGVEIQGAANAPVRSVAGGRVVFADTFTGYGLLVIVDHGERQHTLYARLGELSVRLGDIVLRGHVVGRLPDTQLTRRGLHFEVRVQGKAENPLTWLGDR